MTSKYEETKFALDVERAFTETQAAEIKNLKADIGKLVIERESFKAENERLKAEMGRLMECLSYIERFSYIPHKVRLKIEQATKKTDQDNDK